MYLCLLVFLMQTLMLLTPHQHSMSEYHVAKTLLEKGSVPFRELWGWRGLFPSCHQLPTHQLMWFHCQGNSRGPDLAEVEAAAEGEAKGKASLPSLLCWETKPETHKNQLPPPLLPSLLTDLQAALLYFCSFQREVGGTLREGERTGTWGQQGAEGQKLKLDQCAKVETALSPTASVLRLSSPVCISVHYTHAAVLSLCHSSQLNFRHPWVLWTKCGIKGWALRSLG